jgi:hypothetical protein
MSDHKEMTRLSWHVAFRFRLTQVLPTGDRATAPLLRLMMAVDDVRRVQIKLIEDSERLGGTGADKYTAVGDWLYALRLLISHLHEARRALLGLDSSAPGRADALLADRKDALRSLRALRKRFSSQEYKDSFIARVRNGIGFHYGSSDAPSSPS